MKPIRVNRFPFRAALACWLTCLAVSGSISAQMDVSPNAALSSLTSPHNYVQKRASSYDRNGGNDDFVTIAPGKTITLLDDAGPGVITHIWATIASSEKYHLKKLVLRMYWDDEALASVEAPVGDFFGLGLGDYFQFESTPLAVAPDKALNSFFPMPFHKRARITMTNEGSAEVDAFYFNIDYQFLKKDLPADTMYFHAQYRQTAPARGWTTQWESNGDPVVNTKQNVDGENNYVWMEATGRGHFVGVTMSILQNQDGWWGEGDDMFFVDGEKRPSINGTGSEDYFLGSWDFGGRDGAQQFAHHYYGAPLIAAPERTGGRWCCYRWHGDNPVTFERYLKYTIEHGHANDRGDNFFSVGYWYQAAPYTDFPALPPVEARIPKVRTA